MTTKLAPLIARMDRGIQDTADQLWCWYEDELVESLAALPVLDISKIQFTLEEYADTRHRLRAFLVDSSTAANICSGVWVRFLDILHARCQREPSFLDAFRDKIHSVEFLRLPELASAIRQDISLVLDSPPSSPEYLLLETVRIQQRVFEAIGQATQELLVMERHLPKHS